MINGVKGIFFNKQSGKYDVRINRQNVTYNIGRYNSPEDAQCALDEFLAEYNLKPPEPLIEKYSKKWWAMQYKNQRTKDWSKYR